MANSGASTPSEQKSSQAPQQPPSQGAAQPKIKPPTTIPTQVKKTFPGIYKVLFEKKSLKLEETVSADINGRRKSIRGLVKM